MSKKERKRPRERKWPKYAQIWWDSVEDLRHELADHVSTAKPDELRFQNGRLTRLLSKRIATLDLVNSFFCYRFITHTSRLGYDEPLRLHAEEMQVAGLASVRSFCKAFGKACVSGNGDTGEFLEAFFELRDRMDSIARWIEAQESFSQWMALKHHRAAWRGDGDARTRAYNAWLLANLVEPQWLYEHEFKGRKTLGARVWEGLGLGVNVDNVPWNRRQWANILEQAARLTTKRENCTPLEQWMWWCYPVFQRYGWNTREIQQAAISRGFADAESQKILRKAEANFRRHWMGIGLRIRGKKHKQAHTPPLVEFVRRVRLPEMRKVRGVPIWG